MCGITGFCNAANNWEKQIQKMNDRMFHRGPDAGDYWKSENGEVVLGHRRLAIVDLTPGGAQPFISASGRFVMVYNGEIYNYHVIKKCLTEEDKVKVWKGTSDTEVLLEAFEAYGVEETLKSCKGMFAFALYDKKEKTLTLVRDRVGEKPLYYGFSNGQFVFASDLGSIQVMEGFHNQINRKVLGVYFSYGYIPAPYSIYDGISKLEPGTILTIKAPFRQEDIFIKTYWSMKEAAKKGEENPLSGNEQEASEELERLLKDAIRDQMVADVPVGAFLSAGIDSSTIVSLMQEISGSKKVHTYTIGMKEAQFNEADIAKEIAAVIGTEHTEMYITEQDAKNVIPQIPAMFAEPFADSSQIPTFLVSKMTRQHVTVSLSGDAGDELFCGYNSYENVERIWNRAKKIPNVIRKSAGAMILHSPMDKKNIWHNRGIYLGVNSIEEAYDLGFHEESSIDRIALDSDWLPYKNQQYHSGFLQDEKSNLMLMDMTMYHPDDILVKVDRTAMAVSLETRVPFLDKDVVEFAWTLPIEFKKKDGVTKKVLRDILYKRVPQDMMERPKKGFGVPIAKWLRETELRDWAEELIETTKLKRQGYLNPEIVRMIWDDFIQNNHWRPQIWYILMFQSWLEYCEKKNIFLQ